MATDAVDKSEQLLNRLSNELLFLLLVVVGLGALSASFALRGVLPPMWQDILQAVGMAFFPSGIVSLLISRYAGRATERLLVGTVIATVRQNMGAVVSDIIDVVRTQVSSHLAETTDEVIHASNTAKKEVADAMGHIRRDIAELSPVGVACAALGVEGVYLTRAEGLRAFSRYLDAEVSKALLKEPARVWIVGSSMKGFLSTALAGFDGLAKMQEIVPSVSDLRILLTAPAKADLRAVQEGRGSGEIPDEIRINMSTLKRMGVPYKAIRYYPGTPTVFGIVTSDRMLLNPYPYETEAFRCFCVIVHETNEEREDIFSQYLTYHFRLSWDRAREIGQEVWDKLPDGQEGRPTEPQEQ